MQEKEIFDFRKAAREAIEHELKERHSAKIRIKYLADIDPVQWIKGGNWLDLRTAEDITLKKGEFKLIPLGVAIELPKDCEAIVAPRSSTYKRYKVIMTNSIGVIDHEYCGEGDQWYMPVIAMEDTTIPFNARICQFRVLENQPHSDIVTVETLGNKDRNGIGSTGV